MCILLAIPNSFNFNNASPPCLVKMHYHPRKFTVWKTLYALFCQLFTTLSLLSLPHPSFAKLTRTNHHCYLY
jgi:hypothetical protein